MQRAFQKVQELPLQAKRRKRRKLTDEQKLERAWRLWPEIIEAAEKGILEDDQPPVTIGKKEKEA